MLDRHQYAVVGAIEKEINLATAATRLCMFHANATDQPSVLISCCQKKAHVNGAF